MLRLLALLLLQLFINNEWVGPKAGGKLDVVDPRTGDVIKQVANADAGDVDIAIKAARKAFDEGPWPRMGGKVSVCYAVQACPARHGNSLPARCSLAALDSITVQ